MSSHLSGIQFESAVYFIVHLIIYYLQIAGDANHLNREHDRDQRSEKAREKSYRLKLDESIFTIVH